MKQVTLMILSMLFFGSAAFAGNWACFGTGPTTYCIYTGPVQTTYIASNNMLLVSTETQIPNQYRANLNSFGVNRYNGCALFIDSSNEIFAKSFFAQALTAVSSGKHVKMSGRGNTSGWLKCHDMFLSAQPYY